MTDQKIITQLWVGESLCISSQDVSLVKITNESPLQFSSITKNDDIIKLFNPLLSEPLLFNEYWYNVLINPNATLFHSNDEEISSIQVVCLEPAIYKSWALIQQARYAITIMMTLDTEETNKKSNNIEYLKSIMSVDKPRIKDSLLTVDQPNYIIQNNLQKILKYIVASQFLVECVWSYTSSDELSAEDIFLINEDVICTITQRISSEILWGINDNDDINILSLVNNLFIHFYRWIAENLKNILPSHDSWFVDEQDILILYNNLLSSINILDIINLQPNEHESMILKLNEVPKCIDSIVQALNDIKHIDAKSRNIDLYRDVDDPEDIENDEIIIRDRYWDLNQCLEIALEDEDYKNAITLQKEINDLEVTYPRLLDD